VVLLEFWLGLTVRYRLSRRHRIESPSVCLVRDLLRGGSLRLDHFPFAFWPGSEGPVSVSAFTARRFRSASRSRAPFGGRFRLAEINTQDFPALMSSSSRRSSSGVQWPWRRWATIISSLSALARPVGDRHFPHISTSRLVDRVSRLLVTAASIRPRISPGSHLQRIGDATPSPPRPGPIRGLGEVCPFRP
jgi:hypothetical protein